MVNKLKEIFPQYEIEETIVKKYGEDCKVIQIKDPNDVGIGLAVNQDSIKDMDMITIKKGIEKAMEDSKEVETAALDKDTSTIYPYLINAKNNESRISDCPHRMYHDMAIIYRKKIRGGGILINNQLAEYYGLSEEELFENAAINFGDLNIELDYLSSAVREMCEKEDWLMDVNEDEWDIPFVTENIVVIRERDNNCASAALLNKDILNRACEKLESDEIYVIPSSEDELICTTIDMDIKDLKEIKESVDCQEYGKKLSDHIFVYSWKEEKLEVAI